jgi:hypothetical protein
MVSHVDDEDLSLIALGESASSGDETHLATCVRCQSRLDQLSAVVSSARSISAADRPVDPPAAVWAGITTELSADQPASVTSLSDERTRRRPRVWLLAASAAAVGLLAGAGLVTVLSTADTTEQLVATATLDPIDSSGVIGTATVERAADGNSLTVEVPGLASPDDGYYEVWMATPDTTTMVAIGTLRPGGPATFDLPPNLDPTAFPVVDVSLEHYDGDAAHSATSIVRGQLAT